MHLPKPCASTCWNTALKSPPLIPGLTETEFSLVRFHGDAERAEKVYQEYTPLRPEDVAETILFCASAPRHVCISELTLTCLTQANSTYKIKESELKKGES